jgi:hypothetical protein
MNFKIEDAAVVVVDENGAASAATVANLVLSDSPPLDNINRLNEDGTHLIRPRQCSRSLVIVSKRWELNI